MVHISWPLDPTVYAGLLVLLFGHAWLARGASDARRQHTVYFLAGLFTVWLALETPIDTIFDRYLDSVHMLQHVLLAFVAAPLMLLGLSPALAGSLLRPRAAAHRRVHRAQRPDNRRRGADDLRQGDAGHRGGSRLFPLVQRRAPLRPGDRIGLKGGVVDEIQREHSRSRRQHPVGAP